MKEYLSAEIAKREAERQTITHRLAVLAAELNLLKDILARTSEERAGQDNSATRGASRQRSSGRKGSRLSARWAPVLRAAVERYPDALTNDDVPGIQTAAGQEPGDRNQIRSHVWSTAQAGFYEKLNAGSFRATQAAANAIGVPLGSRRAEHASPAQHVSDTPSGDELFSKG
jgi:hypothetical protein